MAAVILPLAVRRQAARAAAAYCAGFLLIGASIVTYGLGPALAQTTASIAWRNLLVLAGFAVLLASAWLRCARPVPLRLFALILSPWLLALVLYLGLYDAPLVRFGAAAASMACGCMASAVCLLRHKAPRNVGDTGTIAVLLFGVIAKGWVAACALSLACGREALVGVFGVVEPVLFVGLGIFVFQSYALDMIAELDRRALTDPLTGLLNRRALDERLAQALAVARRYGRPLSVVTADIDHFKRINDTHGHPAGDRVLAGFAQLLQRASREVDAVARVGGEEFVVLMPEIDAQAAEEYAERMRAAVQALQGPGGIAVTASFGVAQAGDAGYDAGALLARADEALYAAKNGGRNRVCRARRLRPVESAPPRRGRRFA